MVWYVVLSATLPPTLGGSGVVKRLSLAGGEWGGGNLGVAKSYKNTDPFPLGFAYFGVFWTYDHPRISIFRRRLQHSRVVFSPYMKMTPTIRTQFG